MTPEDLAAWKRRDLARLKALRPRADLKAKARNAAPLKDAIAPLKDLAVLAELGSGAVDVVTDAAAAGAAGFVILTDERWLNGSVEDLRAVRLECDRPVIRRDIIVDDYQLLETRVMLADAAILSARILDRSQLADYVAMAREDLGLACLVEVETERGLTAALGAKAPAVILVNAPSRGKTVSLETTARLRHFIPPGVKVVSRGGLRSPDDRALLGHLRADALLLAEELGNDAAAAIGTWTT